MDWAGQDVLRVPLGGGNGGAGALEWGARTAPD